MEGISARSSSPSGDPIDTRDLSTSTVLVGGDDAASETSSSVSGEVAKTETKWQSFKGETTRRIQNITDEIIVAGATLLAGAVTVTAAVVDALVRCTFGVGRGIFGCDRLSDFTAKYQNAVIDTIASGGEKVGDAISWLLGRTKPLEGQS